MTQVGFTAIGCVWPRLVGGLFVLALTLSGAVSALAEPVPQLVRVTGLSAGDALNVRAAPTAKSEDLGDLKNDTVVEVIAYSDDRTWARIVWQEGNGWIAARYVSEIPRPRLDSGLPVGLICTGDEPFWSFDLAPSGQVTFRAETGDVQAPLLWSTPSYNRGDTRYAFGNDRMTGLLQRTTCNDTMSDRISGWAVDLVLTDDPPRLLSGCCMSR